MLAPVRSEPALTRLAPQYHPDKNPDDPTAADRFKEIAVAYTTLSDPKLRHQYNEFGRSKKDGGEADEMVDPEAIFSTLFGGTSVRERGFRVTLSCRAERADSPL